MKWTKKFQNAYCRSYYKKHKNKHIQNNTNRRLWNLYVVNLFKSTESCKDCGRVYPSECMQFDHTGLKETKVSSQLLSPKTAQREAEKCDLVCANCHCIRTERRRG